MYYFWPFTREPTNIPDFFSTVKIFFLIVFFWGGALGVGYKELILFYFLQDDISSSNVN